MNILIAPDSFKGSLSAAEVADAIEQGLLQFQKDITITKQPISDGGEGFIDAFTGFLSGQLKTVSVHDPLGRKINANYFITDQKTAIIEMAQASGLLLLKQNELNPLITTSYGTGELIADALNCCCHDLIIGLGGSATNDGGCGMLQALGVSLKDAEGNELPFGGGNLGKLKYICSDNLHPALKTANIIIACDVQNPFYGEAGATYVYGPQKGADKDMLETLDANLKHFNELTIEETGFNMQNAAGSGAAGGVGGALMSYCSGKMNPGISVLFDTISFEDKVINSDIIITGEGRVDSQTANGKAIQGIAHLTKKHHKPLFVICGGLKGTQQDLAPLYQSGITSIHPLTNENISTEYAMTHTEELIQQRAFEAAKELFTKGS